MSQPGEHTIAVNPGERWPPRYLTVAETAEALSQRRAAVCRLIHTGKLRSIRLGRTYRIRETGGSHRRWTGAAPAGDDVLDVAECARILRCPEATIHALVYHGHLAAESTSPPESRRIAVSEFRRFLRDAER
jgi:excisionase family DNA binding protein